MVAEYVGAVDGGAFEQSATLFCVDAVRAIKGAIEPGCGGLEVDVADVGLHLARKQTRANDLPRRADVQGSLVASASLVAGPRTPPAAINFDIELRCCFHCVLTVVEVAQRTPVFFIGQVITRVALVDFVVAVVVGASVDDVDGHYGLRSCHLVGRFYGRGLAGGPGRGPGPGPGRGDDGGPPGRDGG